MFRDVDTDKIQYFAIAGSLMLLLFIIELVRRKKIKEEYSLLWLSFSVLFLTMSIWRKSIDILAIKMGIAYAPAAFLLVLVMAIFLILIQFSIIISKQSDQIKVMAQEIGLLKKKVEENEKKKFEG
ncbi:MAG: DUF2304 domain-containing protein [Candidatus Delongbacteria bacterium]|nr:DUF2304 domain-containing protein [Candidatus Delongbacteria bacterium]MBN2833531.1 DUF2304 domain-containing protein [Candidatus Delongbacteria bacterium]